MPDDGLEGFLADLSELEQEVGRLRYVDHLGTFGGEEDGLMSDSRMADSELLTPSLPFSSEAGSEGKRGSRRSRRSRTPKGSGEAE